MPILKFNKKVVARASLTIIVLIFIEHYCSTIDSVCCQIIWGLTSVKVVCYLERTSNDIIVPIAIVLFIVGLESVPTNKWVWYKSFLCCFILLILLYTKSSFLSQLIQKKFQIVWIVCNNFLELLKIRSWKFWPRLIFYWVRHYFMDFRKLVVVHFIIIHKVVFICFKVRSKSHLEWTAISKVKVGTIFALK